MTGASPTDASPTGAIQTGEILHGGAQRLPVRVLNPYDTDVVKISRYRIDVGDRCSPHVHTGKTEAWVIVAGEGEARVGATSLAVREGDVIVTPPGQSHELRNTGKGPLVFVNVVLPTGDEPITTRELEGGDA